MLSSMYSGISGLRNFQTKLDVIGNNIANVNTMGFKKGRVVFKDIISQTVAGASGPGDARGGVNPKQIGLGSQIASIDTIHSPGSPQYTGNTLDLAVSGDGYFQVLDGNEVMYTRAGNFAMDGNGDIVDGDGRYVQGVLAVNGEAGPANGQVGTINIPNTASSMSIGQDGTVYFVDFPAGSNPNDPDNKATLQVAGQIQMAKFSNPGGLEKTGGNLYRVTANSGQPLTGFGLSQGFGALQSGSLEMSNVDLAEEFTDMIVAQRGFQANTRIITTSDEILQELVNLKR